MVFRNYYIPSNPGTIVPAVFMVVAGQLDASYKYVIIVLITIGYALNEGTAVDH